MSIRQNEPLDRDMVRLFTGAPLPMHWNGWNTNSLALSRAGWSFHSDQSMDMYSSSLNLRIAATCPKNEICVMGMTKIHTHQFYEQMQGRGGFDMLYDHLTKSGGMAMGHYTVKDRLVHMDPYAYVSMSKMSPIDIGEIVCFRGEEISLLFKDMPFFKPIKETKEIYIPSNSVDECLDRILQLQFPDQQNIKNGLLLPDKKPIMQAKILTLAA